MSQSLSIRELVSLDEARALEPVIFQYMRFVCGSIETNYQIVVAPEGPARQMMETLENYVAPKGRCFLAEADGEAIGMVFLRPLPTGDMEIKRLFVLPKGRGTGAGSRLARHVIDAATSAGVARLYLDTLPFMETAIGLYGRLGFQETSAYPGSEVAEYGELAPYAMFMVKDLKAG